MLFHLPRIGYYVLWSQEGGVVYCVTKVLTSLVMLSTCIFGYVDGAQVTKTLSAAVTSDEFLLIKSGLIMFAKIIEV